jgi:uncharacterized protein (DUF433 family)
MAAQLSTSTTSASPHVEITPGTCGGKPRITGTRIRVQDIVIWSERMGLSADEIVSRHPQLNLADVYAGLAYYHDHRQAIDDDMKRGRDLVEEMRRMHPSKLPASFAADSDVA